MRGWKGWVLFLAIDGSGKLGQFNLLPRVHAVHIQALTHHPFAKNAKWRGDLNSSTAERMGQPASNKRKYGNWKRKLDPLADLDLRDEKVSLRSFPCAYKPVACSDNRGPLPPDGGIVVTQPVGFSSRTILCTVRSIRFPLRYPNPP